MPEMPAESAPSSAPPPVAAPPDGAPPAAEPPKVDPPKPAETPQETALMRSLRRQQNDFVRKQQEWQNDVRRQEQSFDQRVAEAVAKQIARLREDPFPLLKEHGWDEEKIAGRIVSGGKKPLEETARTTAQELADLKKRLEDQESSASRARTEREYLAVIEKGGWDKFPTALEEWDEAGRLQQTYAMLAEAGARYRQRGETPPQFTDAEIAEALEARAKSVQAARETRRKGRPAPEPKKDAAQAATKDDGNGSGPQGQRAGETATTTLNGRLSSDRASGNAPDILALSPDEQRALIEAEVAKARAAVTGKA